MSIIEELQEIVAEQEREADLSYNLHNTAWRVYNYLKGNCIGFHNKRGAEALISAMRDERRDLPPEYDARQLRKDIREIRTTMPRRIGSSSGGYWLMTSDDEIKGTSMMIKQFVSLTETLTQQGLNPDLLHRIVGALAKKRGKEVDNQLTLRLTEHLREVIHTLSDDLMGEQE